MFSGKLGVSGAFAVIWIYSAELFPTDVRGNALGLGSMVGRIGGVCAPFINKLWKEIPWLPPTVYGIFCIIGGLALFLLPETSGRPMLNTIEEAEAYYGRRASKMSDAVFYKAPKLCTIFDPLNDFIKRRALSILKCRNL